MERSRLPIALHGLQLAALVGYSGNQAHGQGLGSVPRDVDCPAIRASRGVLGVQGGSAHYLRWHQGKVDVGSLSGWSLWSFSTNHKSLILELL